ncbi:hypothetical protein M758_7G036200 [Ceratodon purpureus]|uniref:Uncharacterized protein n=1 Tax=Ceratodon purpureus TaxID=3225 RepID=A0A8T0H720_CERPU|nr:hypothetical protein KC19_7G037700 [Ceratodon purpureus]KAG0610063.1 hypothetical protein M758_7G036200 [Ceratodon purpureus]
MKQVGYSRTSLSTPKPQPQLSCTQTLQNSNSTPRRAGLQTSNLITVVPQHHCAAEKPRLVLQCVEPERNCCRLRSGSRSSTFGRPPTVRG